MICLPRGERSEFYGVEIRFPICVCPELVVSLSNQLVEG